MKFSQTACLLAIFLFSLPAIATAGDIYIRTEDSRADIDYDRDIYVDTGRVRVSVPGNRSSVYADPYRGRTINRNARCYYGGRHVTSQHSRQVIRNGHGSVYSRVSTRCY